MIKNELKQFEKNLESLVLKNKNVISDDLRTFLFVNPKRLRPKIVFLVLKMLGEEINENHHKIALTLELLHNATLLHDDILDNATFRRECETINHKFGDKVSVILGDMLLSLALKELGEINNPKVVSIFSENIFKMTEGELIQQFQKEQIPEFDEYIEKTKNKTALLFLSGVSSALEISNYTEHKQEIENFVINFGIAFQINNDLKSKEDKKNGIYTLPYILYKQENSNCDMIELENKYFQKSKKVLDEFISKALYNLDFAENEYKRELVSLTKKLEEI